MVLTQQNYLMFGFQMLIQILERLQQTMTVILVIARAQDSLAILLLQDQIQSLIV